MSCKWAIPGKLDWQCGINRTLCYGALLFAQFDVKGVRCEVSKCSVNAQIKGKTFGFATIKYYLCC